jgi:hypothetical protein
MKLKSASIGATLGLLLVMATCFPAFSCSNGYCWGAVGVGPNGAWGTAYDYSSDDAAARAAQSGCKGSCTIIRTFFNSCGAIAEGDNGGWGWAWNVSKDEALSSAIAYCVPNDRNCRVTAWACTSR